MPRIEYFCGCLPFRFNFKGGGGVFLKTDGSWGSKVVGRSESVENARNKLKTIDLV